MSVTPILLAFLLDLAGVLAAVWWLRRSRAGLDWVMVAAPLAFGFSYLSGVLFLVPDYQSGCTGLCSGWRGHPIPTHLGDSLGQMVFHPTGFLLNAAVYYAAFLAVSAALAWLAANRRWRERSRRWRLGFALLFLLPLAFSPNLLPPPAPRLPLADQRLAINAARSWRWQLRAQGLSERRLAVEDVRTHPDGQRHRLCFRVYTWFYLPYRHIYIDLEPAGVRATGGGVIPLDASCWVQP